MVTTALRDLMERHPDLTAYGYFPASELGRARFTEDRALLATSQDQIDRVAAWLATAPRTNRPHQVGSYWLKHVFERSHGHEHLANGVLIAAALLSGIRLRVLPPNALLAIDQRWVQRQEPAERGTAPGRLRALRERSR